MLLFDGNHIKHSVQGHLLFNIKELKIYQKDRIGIIGRNGSGKTSLLQIIAQEMVPDKGNINQHTSIELIPQLKRTNTTQSGGEVTQEYIQQALNRHAGLILADEPTTNLDTNHIEWVEKSLKNWHGGIVVISHDRALLDGLCSTIWEIRDTQLTEYKGNYSDYAKQKEVEWQQEQLAFEKYEKERKQLVKAIQQKEKQAQRATKKPKNVSNSEYRQKGAKTYYANQQKKLQKTASAMETRLENLEKVDTTKETPPIKMNLPDQDTFKNRIIIRAEDVAGKAGNRILWNKTNFFVRGGDKLAIIGANGSGKTTLIKKIIDQAPGISLSLAVKIGYFAQDLTVLDNEKTILENVKIASNQDETLIRKVLARMHFFDDDVYKSVGVLSGGERVKVVLAKIFLSNMNMLILDEPTNYLDVESLEALETLLQDYEGTIIFVTHDRQFTQNIATHILEIENEQITFFDGSYEEYKSSQTQHEKCSRKDELLLLETKISDVLSRLSVEPSEELEKEFQQLLKEKQKLQ